MSIHLRMTTFFLVFGLAVQALGGVPNEIHHQGVIAVHGERFSGEGDFYFALVDELGYNLWTNDGTNVEPPSQDRPDSPIILTVVNGVYRVRLGNTEEDLTTTAIPRAVFNENDHIALRIWFDDGVNGVHRLTPDQVLTGAPYAQRLPNVFVDESTGNVGVGTTAPTSKLSVSGSADFSGNVGIATTTPSNALSVDGDADFSGNVGIGITAPRSLLDVAGAMQWGGAARPYAHSAVHGGGTYLEHYGTDATDDSLRFRTTLGGSGDGDLQIKLDPGDGITFETCEELEEHGHERMRITGGGNVGIGTTAPSRKLTIEDTRGTRALRMQTDSTVLEAMYGGILFGRPDHELASILYGTEDSPSKGYLSFATNDGVSHAERVRIDESGDVGIGTTSPQNTLDVAGAAAIGSAYSGVETAPANGLLVEGNVGIGTTEPTNRLSVSGSADFSGNVDIEGTLRVRKYAGEFDHGVWHDIESYDVSEVPFAALYLFTLYDEVTPDSRDPMICLQLVPVTVGKEQGGHYRNPEVNVLYSRTPFSSTGLWLNFQFVEEEPVGLGQWTLQAQLPAGHTYHNGTKVYYSKIQAFP